MMLIDGEKKPSQIATYFLFILSALYMHLKIQLDSGPLNEHKQDQSLFNSVKKDAMSDEI